VRTRAWLVGGFVTDELQSCSSQLITEANNLKTLGVTLVGIVLNHRSTVDLSCVRQLVSANMYVEITDTARYAAAVSDAARAVCPPDYWSKSPSCRPMKYCRGEFVSLISSRPSSSRLTSFHLN